LAIQANFAVREGVSSNILETPYGLVQARSARRPMEDEGY